MRWILRPPADKISFAVALVRAVYVYLRCFVAGLRGWRGGLGATLGVGLAQDCSCTTTNLALACRLPHPMVGGGYIRDYEGINTGKHMLMRFPR